MSYTLYYVYTFLYFDQNVYAHASEDTVYKETLNDSTHTSWCIRLSHIALHLSNATLDYFLSPKGGMNAIPSAVSLSLPLPKTPAALRALTCARNSLNTSLSFQRAGTGRKAGLNVPTVCAHSPLAGATGCVSRTPASAPWVPRYGSELCMAPAAVGGAAEPSWVRVGWVAQ